MVLLREKKNPLLALTGNQACAKNKPPDAWMVLSILLIKAFNDSKEINFPKQFTLLAKETKNTYKTYIINTYTKEKCAYNWKRGIILEVKIQLAVPMEKRRMSLSSFMNCEHKLTSLNVQKGKVTICILFKQWRLQK